MFTKHAGIVNCHEYMHQSLSVCHPASDTFTCMLLGLFWFTQFLMEIPPQKMSWKSILILSSRLRLGLPGGSFPQVSSPKTLYMPPPIPHTYYIPLHLILLDLITRTILGVGYRPLRFSLCSFRHSLVTSSLLWRNILLSVSSSPTVGDLSRSISFLSTKVHHTFKIRFCKS